MSDFICQKYTDCSSCSHYQKQIFKYRSFPKGMMIPKERCSQNTIYFLISGSVRVTSDEHPDTVFHDGQFIMQPIGSRVEFHILGIHGMHPLPVRDSAKHLYRPFQQRTGTGERVSHAPYRHGYVFPFAPFYQRAQNVPQQRTPVCGIPESQADGVVFPAQLLLYIERDRQFLCTYI